MEEKYAIQAILAELDLAKGLFPEWPHDPIHAVAVMAEESGEAVQAALQWAYGGGSKAEFEKELVQTGAMVLRCLENLPNYKPTKRY